MRRALSGSCPPYGDDQFSPRVDTACRPFDFTLLFEDVFFVALPAAMFLLLLPWRLRHLWKAPVKLTSYRLAICKLILIALLLTFQILFPISRLHQPTLRTRLSLASAVLPAAATLTSAILSLLEDQRSLKPSDLLVLYYSTSAILSTARLRSLWLIPVDSFARATWTLIFLTTVAIVLVESTPKTRYLHPRYKTTATAEQTTGFWSRSFYFWTLPFFQTGYATVLQLGDIPRVDVDLEEESTWTRLDEAWRREGPGKHRLLRATLRANAGAVFAAVPYRLALSAFSFCQPFLIGASVSYLNARPGREQRERERYGPALVGAFVLAYFGIAISRALYWRQTNRLLTKFRAGLVAMIYRHTTTLQTSAANDSAALTLMGTDVERIVQSSRLMHEIWASAPEVAIAIWLLARQISVASVVPLVVCIASVAAASPVAARFGPAQREWVECVQRRVAVTASMLGDMKAVKMLGLTDVLETIILKLRAVELRTSENFRSLLIWQIMIGNTPTTFAPFVTFAVYAIIATVRRDETLLGAQAFASLALIGLVTNPVLLFCQAFPSCMQAVACFGRIEAYLFRKPVSPPLPLPSPPPADVSPSPGSLESLQNNVPLSTQSQPAPPTSEQTPLVRFERADISWSADDASEIVLRGLSLTIRPGFTAIVGPVASGKSTLLASMVGETILKDGGGGSATSSLTGVAFCSQTPWIMNDTIRHNITGGLGVFDQKWYDFSVARSGLQADIATMHGGDLAVAGSQGGSLSGGQRQRVALARAVYSRLPIVILDDVMSGLDPTTASMVTVKLFSKDGYFRKAGISVVIATHSRRVLPHVDEIIVLENGRVVEQGSYEELQQRAANLVENTEASLNFKDESADTPSDIYEQQLPHRPSHAPGPAGAASQEPALQRRNGSWAVYAYYARCAGPTAVLLWGTYTLIGAVAASCTPIWIERWTAANEREPNQELGLYLGVYALLVVLANVGPAMECWTFFIRVINNTALKLHSDLLDATLKAPFSFFQTTDTGTITNRFSQDMDLIDMTLPNQAIQFTTGATECLVELIIICVLGKYLSATIPILAAALFLVQRYYLRTSRQVRFIDIEAKAPLYKHFIETVQGVATIRAFGWAPAFHDRNSQMLNRSQRPFYMLLCIQQWLALVLDLTVGALAVVLVAVAVATASGRSGGISAGALGVALVLTLQFNSLLIQAIQAWTRLETSIGAVARVREFMRDTPREEVVGVVKMGLAGGWPQLGAIGFRDVVARYAITLSIAPGQKVAICGSSGSGKTSLIMALLQMIELPEGQITIDGVDLSRLRGNDVRSRLNVVPQDPYFIPGAVRFNLDPRQRSSDADIEAAVRKVGLEARISAGGGLDMDLVASEWSQGERQLLCLARALLVRSRILILDEATSSVDQGTEATMQAVIDSEFKDATVIAVLHRLTYIDRFDRIAVLGQGKLLECDAPQALLGREDSAFRELYRTHNSTH
ncbi:putative ATP-binding cassette transporter [Bombardia bombarda]|uniref:ATP-binding cassette transporter n=1 Tax=Bombardia bombarda TaxID=252184 RepID=A0AA39XIX4_9PEZI|nr:putative ATP-binding cassette transporter [Bombardia bombarda]